MSRESFSFTTDPKVIEAVARAIKENIAIQRMHPVFESIAYSQVGKAAILAYQQSVDNGWRDIESAPPPKDRGILISGGTVMYDASAYPSDDPFDGVTIAWWWRDGWSSGYGAEYDGEYWHKPKYWQPLPLPPGAPKKPPLRSAEEVAREMMIALSTAGDDSIRESIIAAAILKDRQEGGR